jgi:hypothetical protein
MRYPKNPWQSLRFLFALCVLAVSLPARAENAYTNHAGNVISGVVIALDTRTATLSNTTETLTLPLSIFPASEQRRLAADYLTSHPDAPPTVLQLPDTILRPLDATIRSLRRSRLRASKGLCTQEESAAFCTRTTTALDTWLTQKEQSGALLPSEHQAILSTLP